MSNSSVLPPDFVRDVLPTLPDPMALQDALTMQPPPVSVRFNIHKSSEVVREQLPLAAEVPWCEAAYYLQYRPSFTFDPVFHAGAYYVQEASSMFIHYLLTQLFPQRPPLRVLDACAAPGGKSTLLLNWLSPDSLLVSNELIKNRYRTLTEQLEKWGVANVIATHHSPEDLGKLTDFFDIMVVDAPCSGEGMFRKDPTARQEWSMAHVAMCGVRQQHILDSLLPALRQNGILLYATCTFNAIENQTNVQWLKDTFGLEEVIVPTPPDWGIHYNRGYQFFPHRTQGEGFFCVCLRKKSATHLPRKAAAKFRKLTPVSSALATQLQSWVAPEAAMQYYLTPQETIVGVPAPLLPDFKLTEQALSRLQFNFAVGTLKGRDFIPAHSLALSKHLAPQVTRVAVDKAVAVKYLQREPLPPLAGATGWAVLTYEGLALGWVKILPNRVNNYYPTQLRILARTP